MFQFGKRMNSKIEKLEKMLKEIIDKIDNENTDDKKEEESLTTTIALSAAATAFSEAMVIAIQQGKADTLDKIGNSWMLMTQVLEDIESEKLGKEKVQKIGFVKEDSSEVEKLLELEV